MPYVKFKGTNNEYVRLHQWVNRNLGKPKICWECGSTDKKFYHWANTSQEYKKDLSDWRRLCPSCHARENNPGGCGYGHKLTPDNTYIRPTGVKECRICIKSRYEMTSQKCVKPYKQHAWNHLPPKLGDEILISKCKRCGANGTRKVKPPKPSPQEEE